MHDIQVFFQLGCGICGFIDIAPVYKPGSTDLNGDARAFVCIFRSLRAGPACNQNRYRATLNSCLEALQIAGVDTLNEVRTELGSHTTG